MSPSITLSSPIKKKQIYTAETVKQSSQLLVVYKTGVYDVTKFAPYHPGGQLAIKHMAGKDATDVMMVFHPPEVFEKMEKYKVGDYAGRMDELEKDNDVIVSRIRMEKTYEEKIRIAEGFRDLNQKIRHLGFYKPNYFFYIKRAVFFACLWSFAVYTLMSNSESLFNVVLSAVLFGTLWHGLAFSAHDAGHHSVTCNSKVDDIIGILLSSFIGGLSIGWWRYNHNIHHIVTNEPENDPDIQHLPFFAVSTKFFQNLYSSFYNRVMEFDAFAKAVIPIQHYLYYPVMSFGRFNLYFLSISYLLDFKSSEKRKYRWFELSGIVFFWCWFGYLCSHISFPLVLLFVYVSHAATMILHVQITLSHFAMSTELPSYESFYEKGLRTTMNVDCPVWMDWFHGGLQFQIEHHLFPRVPRAYFRQLSPLVQEFCKEYGLEYHTYTFSKGNGIILGALKEVGNQISLLIKSADPKFRYKNSNV